MQKSVQQFYVFVCVMIPRAVFRFALYVSFDGKKKRSYNIIRGRTIQFSLLIDLLHKFHSIFSFYYLFENRIVFQNSFKGGKLTYNFTHILGGISFKHKIKTLI